MTPTKFRAKRASDGQWVEGWYALHHIPATDNHDQLIGYDVVPMLFNDDPGQRGKGSFWHTIDPDTLQEVKSSLFDGKL